MTETLITDVERRAYLTSRIRQLELDQYAVSTALEESKADPHDDDVDARSAKTRDVESMEARLELLRGQLGALPAVDSESTA